MKKLFFILTVLCGLCLPSIVKEISAAEMDFIEGSKKLVSIDLRDSDIVDVLKFLAQKGKFNIFVSPAVKGRVTLYLEQVSIADILNIVLLSNNLGYYDKHGIVYIMTQEEYRVRYGQDYGDAREVRMIKLKYASPSQVFKMLDPTKSKVASIIVDEQTGTIILMEVSEKLQFMLKIVEELDQPPQTKVFDLSYSKAADVQTLLNAKLGSKGVDSISADTRSNQIIVTALPDRMKEIEEMVRRLDRKTREVAIDTQIVKIDLTDNYQQGIDWRYIFNQGLLEPLDFKVTLPSSSSNIASTFGSIGYSKFTALGGFTGLLKYLKIFGDTHILASPRITEIEGEEAKILIGSREAYVTSTTTTGTGTSTVSENVSFIDVGISLSVSSLINKEGYVTMKIKPEISSVREFLTTPSKNKIPIVDTTQAETRLMVKDGTTIILGGLRKNQKQAISQQLPGLSNLPIAGHLFKNHDTALTQSELVVFLTPHLIEGDKNMSLEDKLDVKGIQAYPSKVSTTTAVVPVPPAKNSYLKGD